jgi:2-aminoadipate transaminase
MPNFQNPTGVTMSLDTRRRLVELARQQAIPIIEDDYEKDLRFLGKPLPSLKALDPGGMIMHLGTFSKGLFPGLRLGWIAAPPAVLARLSLVKRYSDLHTNTLAQAVIAAFCQEGHYERHLKKLHQIYRERRACILAALKRHFPPEVSWTQPEGGYALWVSLPPAVHVQDLLAEAREEGVVFTPGNYFFDGEQRENGLRLSIARTDPGTIERGTEVLGRLIRRRLQSHAGGRDKPRQAAARALPHL